MHRASTRASRADFKLLTLDRIGKEEAERIDWSSPRLICIAADFTKYDLHAVQQINRNIDLVRYRKFGKDLLALELVHGVTMAGALFDVAELKVKAKIGDKPVTQALVDLEAEFKDV